MKINLKPLSINEAFQGKRFKTKKAKDFERDFCLLAPKIEKIEGRVKIIYKFGLKNHARTDYDNLIKILQDCIVKAGYIEDDRKIYRAVIEKVPAEKDYIEIFISKLKT